MRKMFVLFLLCSIILAVQAKPQIMSVSPEMVAVKKWVMYDSDHEVRFQADKVCRKFGKKASKPVAQTCDPQEQLCVNPVIHFACIDK